RSANPWRLGGNHQALAYAYEVDERGREVKLAVYDPNHPDRDDVTISFCFGGRERSEGLVYSTGAPLRGFFRTRHPFCHPSAGLLRATLQNSSPIRLTAACGRVICLLIVQQTLMSTKAETRERLVDTARQLFWEQGYGATGIAEILKGADAGSGSLYYFFPTKEDLLLAVLEWYTANLWPIVVQPVFDRVGDPSERVFGILDGYRQQLVHNKFQHGCPVGSLALELSNSHPQARKLLAENFSGWRDAIKLCLDAAAGRLPDQTDTEALAFFVLTTMEGAVMLARTYRSIDPYDNAVTLL